MHTASRFRAFVLALAATSLSALIAGCAGPIVDTQWRSIELPAAYLRGAIVLVGCETGDPGLRRLCEDGVMADLRAHGASPVLAAPGTVAAVPGGVADAQYLPAARERGAKAVLSVAVGLSSRAVSPPFWLSLGLGGFGSHSMGGIGVSAPIGGGQVSAGYSATGRITDVASGRLMWSARASTPPSSDVNAQLAELSKSLLDAAGGAGLF